jgi:hypothetical protein
VYIEKQRKLQETGGCCTERCFMICAVHQILYKVISSRNVRWVEHVASRCIGKDRNSCTVLVRKPEVKRPLESPRHSWDDHIKMYLKYVGWEVMDGIHLALDRNK